MKILVTGCKGQLGRELHTALEKRFPGSTVYVGKEELDLTDRKAVDSFLAAGDFTHVINCAAYTAVDRAEEESSQCAAVNIDAVANLARNAEALGLRIIHISTDYVFDGRSCRPYTESDKVNPLSQYGNSKRKSETVLLGLAPDSIVIRSGWLYSPYGKNFVKTIISLARENKRLRVVSDQVGTPTSAADLASAIVTILSAQQWIPGIVNFSDEGVASWYDFAVAILRLAGLDSTKVTPIRSDEYPTQATRPYYSVLDKSKFKATYGVAIPHWETSLARCIERIKTEEADV